MEGNVNCIETVHICCLQLNMSVGGMDIVNKTMSGRSRVSDNVLVLIGYNLHITEHGDSHKLSRITKTCF